MNSGRVSRDTILHIPVSDIKPNPEQPRASFCRIEELSDSIKIHGIQNPIIVEPDGEGKYTLISGERRTRAAILAGMETIPAIICEGGDLAVLALIENVQREELSPIEEAKAYQKILNRGVSQEELSRQIGKDRSYIAQKIRLLVFENIGICGISEGGMRQLLRLKFVDDIATKECQYRDSFFLWICDRIIWRPHRAQSVKEIGDLVDEYIMALTFDFSEHYDDNKSLNSSKIGALEYFGFIRFQVAPDVSRITEHQRDEMLKTSSRWVKKHCSDEGAA